MIYVTGVFVDSEVGGDVVLCQDLSSVTLHRLHRCLSIECTLVDRVLHVRRHNG